MAWLGIGYVAVTNLYSRDGRYRVAICRRPDGLFCYMSERLNTYDDESDPEPDGKPDWEPDQQSGIHATADEAEAAARTELHWLREEL